MKVALYARVSTEQQIENYSIPLQIERIKGYCISRGWNQIEEYIDAGYTGSNINRPALAKLQQDIKSGLIDVAIVYRLDRLSRSQRDTLFLIEDVFLPNNVEFISISETIDTSTPFGRAMVGVLSVFAQLERETITERLRSGRYKMVKEEGLWSGGADASPYGYTRLDRGVLVVNEEERKHIIRIFEEYVKLKSYIKVQDKLLEEGFPLLRPQRIVNLLKNRLYIGEVSFAGQWFPGTHEPIISKELFEEAQRIKEKYKGINFGKIKNNSLRQKVVCGCCGENYVSYGHTDKLADGSKVRYYYMICRRRKMPRYYPSKCFNKTWKREDLESWLFDKILGLNNKKNLKVRKNKKIDFQKDFLEIDKKIKKVLDLYVDGVIDKTRLDEKINELNKQKNELIKQRENRSNRDELIAKLFENQLPDLRHSSVEERTYIIDLLVKDIIITENTAEVNWNF
ncbi:recombinase family protein [Turicibacter sanguinis]|uniref:recombinase family protein n=1 Tax=Turicibacter sanguinis TaxID=154288 RepID=UPI00232D30DE|nr:recombinase family protein [Turicibacter sanguinis]MDB8575185.1 recombinase family protein [Turicibacter sanguinis]MDB8577274.1 recombinase family protein [Turicibacter sanguinis]MDB8583818.1 recombinase family protein [Turicibacter sanguinis]MDB8586602.1 recombinase family protein [Turicibacter sanguinis]MDB8597538.1 recombinase family protein [Turicibacter sanguinis]